MRRLRTILLWSRAEALNALAVWLVAGVIRDEEVILREAALFLLRATPFLVISSVEESVVGNLVRGEVTVGSG